MLERQIVELLTSQERPGTDVQPWYVTRHAHRLIPSLAIVNHILRLCRSVHPFEVAPEADAVGKTDSLSIPNCFLSILLP